MSNLCFEMIIWSYQSTQLGLLPGGGAVQSQHPIAGPDAALFEPSQIHLQDELCRSHRRVVGRRQWRHVGDIQNYSAFIHKRDA